MSFTLDGHGLSISMFEAANNDGPEQAIKTEGLPLDFAYAIRDFFVYGLTSSPLEAMVDEDGRAECIGLKDPE